MAIVKTQFIDSTYLKENTLLEFNIDDAKINPMIFKAQDMHLAEVLGSDFYNHLMLEAFNESTTPGSLTQDEKDLIDEYIVPMVCEWTHYMLCAQLRTKFTNKSASLESSEYSSNAERKDMQDIKAEIRDMAEFYTQRLVKYLCDFYNLFPLYWNPSDTENLPKKNKAYFNGIYLGNGGGTCCDNGAQYRNKWG